MAAPDYVPVNPMDDVRTYASPPRRPDSWRADRPGDLEGTQPRGEGFGNPGPDQGYALKLAHDVFLPQLHLGAVRAEDAVAGCLGIALKRAALYGRAPVAHDLRIAFGVWGFLSDAPPADLVTVREELFSQAANSHHYAEGLRIVEAVPEATLRKPVAQVEEEHAIDWRDLVVVAD
ncbi:MAG: hypothetical protein M3527_00805 [Actinomycetota bacterium]|nr:hypothetical protein [Actinomycetota bacterium]